MINIYDKFETDFSHNGLVVLNNCKSCFVTQELNGAYYLELEYPRDKFEKYKYIEGWNVIKADGQLFRIPQFTRQQSNGLNVRVRADHIFYDLNNDLNEDTRADNKTVTEALKINLAINPKFNILNSDITTLNNAYFVRENPVQSIFQKILPRWHGELYRDNFNVAIKSRIGKDTGILISYGKDIIGFEQTLDYSTILTKIKPIGKDGITIDLVNNGSKWLDSPRTNNYPFKVVRELEFNDIEDAVELKKKVENLWGTIDLPSINYRVNFLELSKTQEYKQFKDMEKLNLGDTVTVKHKIFNVDLTARVIKIKKNVLTDKIEEIELGNFKDNMNSLFNNLSYKIANTNSLVQETKKQFSTYVQQNDTKIELIAENVGKTQADFKIEADKITSTVNNLEKNTNTKFEQTAENMNAKVSKGELVQQINLSAEGLLIDVTKVNMKNALMSWENLDTNAQNTVKSYAGKDGLNGANGTNGRDGTNGIDSYIPSWVRFTEISKDFVKSGLLQGNRIYTSSSENAWIELNGSWIYFYYQNNLIFKLGTTGSNGKPQLFFSNGCSIDTFEGDLRLRTSDTNYLRINNEGGMDFVHNGNTAVLVDSNGNHIGGGGNNYVFG